MTKQLMFDTFIKQCDGRGRCLSASGGCLYVPYDGDHPGCAIGCQPEFKRAWIESGLSEDNINGLGGIGDNHPAMNTILEKAFPGIDIEFLMCLQDLHDDVGSWRDNANLKEEALRSFAKNHGLKYE